MKNIAKSATAISMQDESGNREKNLIKVINAIQWWSSKHQHIRKLHRAARPNREKTMLDINKCSANSEMPGKQ